MQLMDLLTISTASRCQLVVPQFVLSDRCQTRGCGTCAGDWGGTNDAGQFLLPPALSLESAQLSAGGAYLLDNGRVFLLWLGAGVPVEYIAQVRTTRHHACVTCSDTRAVRHKSLPGTRHALVGCLLCCPSATLPYPACLGHLPSLSESRNRPIMLT